MVQLCADAASITKEHQLQLQRLNMQQANGQLVRPLGLASYSKAPRVRWPPAKVKTWQHTGACYAMLMEKGTWNLAEH